MANKNNNSKKFKGKRCHISKNEMMWAICHQNDIRCKHDSHGLVHSTPLLDDDNWDYEIDISGETND